MKMLWGLRMKKFPRTFIVLEKDALGGYHLVGHPDKPWIVEDPREDLVFLGIS